MSQSASSAVPYVEAVETPRVVVLNGPAGVGKTTTARALAATAVNGACIHGDELRNFVVVRRNGTVQQGLGYRNGASIATNFVDAGYGLVVFEYVFESPNAIAHFENSYRACAPVHFFTLWAPLSTVRRRERGRPGRRPLADQLLTCYRAIELHLDQMGDVIQTGGRDVQSVVTEIVDRCDRGEGQLMPGCPHRRPEAVSALDSSAA